jgi:ATP-dependent DNA helicase RecG
MTVNMISSLEDIGLLRESVDLECKLAAGRDGKGKLPKDFWETYSAFANGGGGIVLLGVQETAAGFELQGVKNPSKLIDELWDLLNNRQKVSVNLLATDHVTELEIDGSTVVQIFVPSASRTKKPVFINQNPLTGTYKRNNTGDFRLDEESVKRMLAEQVEDTRDGEILVGYSITDLDPQSLREYRQIYVTRQPEHPWNTLDDLSFLEKIGAWKRNRATDEAGITKAGLLMFGEHPVIQDVFPHYMLDYQERPEAKTEARWVDRVTLDGSWSGNLFDFYRRVFKKLAADLKVPFVLDAGVRQEETPVHSALREALVNALVHADYSRRASVLIVKRPDLFGFRNPGLMRISPAQAQQGGESDCRNRLLHQMFGYVGLGERAGSGVPKIYHGWESQHWRAPLLEQKEEPSEQTVLQLRMLDLLPESALTALRSMFADFDVLSHTERVILATVYTEGTANHQRLSQVTIDHSHDLTIALQSLCKAHKLSSTGNTRGTTYHLHGAEPLNPDDVFTGTQQMLGANVGSVTESSLPLRSSSPHLGSSSSYRDEKGRLVSRELKMPIVDDLEALDQTLRKALLDKAAPARIKRKLPKEEMEALILSLCANCFVTIEVLSQLLDRKPEPLRSNSLKPMVDSGALSRAFPSTPNHSKQGYATSSH